MLCGIKVGDALKIKKISEKFLSEGNGDEDNVSIQSYLYKITIKITILILQIQFQVLLINPLPFAVFVLCDYALSFICLISSNVLEWKLKRLS